MLIFLMLRIVVHAEVISLLVMLITYVSSDDEIILREMLMYDIHTYIYLHKYIYLHTQTQMYKTR